MLDTMFGLEMQEVQHSLENIKHWIRTIRQLIGILAFMRLENLICQQWLILFWLKWIRPLFTMLVIPRVVQFYLQCFLFDPNTIQKLNLCMQWHRLYFLEIQNRSIEIYCNIWIKLRLPPFFNYVYNFIFLRIICRCYQSLWNFMRYHLGVQNWNP